MDLTLLVVRFLVLASLAVPVSAAPPGWHYSDRVYDARWRPLPLERSQSILRHLAMQAGYADPGYMQTILTLDVPREAPRVRLIAAPDSVWHAPASPEHWETGERTYVVVVEGGAPDSLRVLLADESSFWVKLEIKQSRKDKRL